MRASPSSRIVRSGLGPSLAFALAALAMPVPGSAQVREVISKEIAVGRDEAALSLELEGGRDLDVVLVGGVARIGGEEAGPYTPGSALEDAWRELLGTAVALDDGPLTRALVDWEPPEGMEDREMELARRIDASLESALSSGPEGAEAASVEGIRLGAARVRVGEDIVIGPEDELDGTLVAVDSDVEVEGLVRGDVVLVDGTLRVRRGGRVTGDVRLVGSRLLDRAGEIDGSVVDVEPGAVRTDEDFRDSLREELLEARAEVAELAREADRSARADRDRDRGWSLLRPFRAFGRGLAGAFGVILNTAVVALLGWAVVFFAPDNLAVVADTVRRSPGRSTMVGMAGAFLLLPAWVLGALALIVTVVGIFALPFWFALFPLAAAVAACLGFYAVASGLGEHLARRRYPFLDWIRSSNAYTLVTGGLILLAAPFLLANVAEMAMFLGFLEGLLTFAGWVALALAACMGFGAVLITRGGRRPDYYGPDPLDDDDLDWTGGSAPTPPESGGSEPGGSEPGDEWWDVAPTEEPSSPATDDSPSEG